MTTQRGSKAAKADVPSVVQDEPSVVVPSAERAQPRAVGNELDAEHARVFVRARQKRIDAILARNNRGKG